MPDLIEQNNRGRNFGPARKRIPAIAKLPGKRTAKK